MSTLQVIKSYILFSILYAIPCYWLWHGAYFNQSLQSGLMHGYVSGQLMFTIIVIVMYYKIQGSYKTNVRKQ